FDALGTSGIDRIEISRGAGASLIAPEAIGGVVNIIRKKATEDSSTINFSLGDHGYKLFSGTVTKVNEKGSAGTTFSAQYNEQGQVDTDDNGINESPKIGSYVLAGKHYIDFNPRNNLTFDVTSLKSSTFGGPMNKANFQPTVNTGGSPTFEDNDVRKKYTGKTEQVTEIIEIQRNEATIAFTHQINDYSNFVLKQSYAQQIQDSWYEGSDYYHKNQTLFSDVQYNNQVSDNHFITVGVDNKDENLKSQSEAFYVVAGRDRDDYEYQSLGLYLRDIWTPSSNVELATAVRVNKITTDWTDQLAAGDEIDKTIVSPRFHLKWGHTDYLTSRLGAGVGYRAPLTFFESEHGILDDGFDVNVSKLEESESFSYSLSYESDRFIANGGATHTIVENLAYVDDSGSIPELRNTSQVVHVTNYDVTFGYQVTKPLSLGLSYEYFDYDDQYKSLLTLAAIEQRIKFDIEYETDRFFVSFLMTWIGSRDLKEYGYSDRFNVSTGSDAKSTDAESYFTLDLKLAYNLSKNYKVYTGIKNLLDETQDESPLFFDSDGEFDVTHIYGPLRGRQLYAGLQASF
ncbi:MAG: TonB-dependent receptor plug domain-containing protein, partial [Bacteriovoracaceae bacterium]